MENQEKQFAVELKTGEFDFKEHALKAILGALYYLFIYIPFILPFKIWGKAATRVSSLWDTKSLAYNENNSNYPIYLFYFEYMINFIFDAVTVLIWPIGFIYITYTFMHVMEFNNFMDNYVKLLLGLYTSVIFVRAGKETLFFVINNLVIWVLGVLVNIGKFIKNLWLLNFVIKK